jgi:predicted Rossmann-fold nucleotide-binding protein
MQIKTSSEVFFLEKIINFEWMLESGTISKQDLDCFKYVDSPEEAWQEINQLLTT